MFSLKRHHKVAIAFFLVLIVVALTLVIFIESSGAIAYDVSDSLTGTTETDLPEIGWTEAGKDLYNLNLVLGELSGEKTGFFTLVGQTCADDMFDHSIVLMQEPCIVLRDVIDSSLKAGESNYILLFFAHYYPQEAIYGDKEYYCEGSAWEDELGCLGNEGVVTPFWLAKSTIKVTGCGFPQTEEEREEILGNLIDAGMVHDELFRTKFSGCAVISQETVLTLERELGNEMYGW